MLEKNVNPMGQSSWEAISGGLAVSSTQSAVEYHIRSVDNDATLPSSPESKPEGVAESLESEAVATLSLEPEEVTTEAILAYVPRRSTNQETLTIIHADEHSDTVLQEPPKVPRTAGEGKHGRVVSITSEFLSDLNGRLVRTVISPPPQLHRAPMPPSSPRPQSRSGRSSPMSVPLGERTSFGEQAVKVESSSGNDDTHLGVAAAAQTTHWSWRAENAPQVVVQKLKEEKRKKRAAKKVKEAEQQKEIEQAQKVELELKAAEEQKKFESLTHNEKMHEVTKYARANRIYMEMHPQGDNPANPNNPLALITSITTITQ